MKAFLTAALVTGLASVAIPQSTRAQSAMPAPGAPAPANGQTFDQAIEIIDPTTLRVCADPSALPSSNDKGEGYENKIAALLAKKLNKDLAYFYYPMATGFVRKTLGDRRCDVIIGFPQGDELVQNTNHYYTTTYALIYKKGSDLAGVDTIEDPRLKGKSVGIVAGTPPGDLMTRAGLMPKARPYPLVVDTRYTNSAQDMMNDLKAGTIDAGILWGPMAGWYAKKVLGDDAVIVPLTKETSGPKMSYRITMGVRAIDQNWKRQLNRLIKDNQAEINQILTSYGIPLLDDNGQPLVIK